MTAAVYKITNTVTGKVYVGKSVDVKRRWVQPKDAFASGDPRGRSPIAMVEDAKRFGKSSFVFEIIQEFDISEIPLMGKKELEMVVQLETTDPMKGYNRISFVGDGEKMMAREYAKIEEKGKKNYSTNVLGYGKSRIVQMNLDGEIVREWGSIKMLMDGFGERLTRQGLHQACASENRTYKGFKWRMIRCR